MPDRPTYRPVYKAIHRTLTVCGVDRRLFFLALILGAATFNLFYSFLAGLLMFLGLYRILPPTLSRSMCLRRGAKLEIGSSGWIRTSNPPVNSE